MQLAQSLEIRQQHTQRIDPRQILASEIMAWTTVELEAAVERELAENPALEPVEDEPRDYYGAAEAPVRPAPTEELPRNLLLSETVSNLIRDDSARLPSAMADAAAAEGDDPLDRVAAHLSLRDHLRRQIGQVVTGKQAMLVRYLIECVNDKGYLVCDPRDIGERFRVSRAEIEQAIRALQTMDPPGIGARDLRECLLLQVEYLMQTGECHPLAKPILTQCWDELVTHREERIASRLKSPVTEVRNAIQFLQKALTPYPSGLAGDMRDGRGRGSSQTVRPDLVFVRREMGFSVELTQDFEKSLTVAPLWKKLEERADRETDEAMRRYVRDHVERAEAFLTGIHRRGQTLRRIANSLVREQQGYLETGNRAFLRPLTRQALAEQLGLDESVVSRAVADKWVQLPNGDVIPLDTFFGNAHAVREALVNLVASENPETPYSDEELADMLTAQGFPLARRTVAKYRGLEKILPARLRRRAA
ncbi:MAG: RNA polymerase factor sigma-54 [Armatimonadaceae bacterium]